MGGERNANESRFQEMLDIVIRSLKKVPEHRKERNIQHEIVDAGLGALRVNWCEVTVVREDTGKQLYHSAWITSHDLTEKTVPEVVVAGCAHSKVKNENFNVLKNRGYRLEHNYGHGKQHLPTGLLSLPLKAFLFHTVLHLFNLQYQATREELGPRRTFFSDLCALTRYMYFDSWGHLLDFMYEQLELAPG